MQPALTGSPSQIELAEQLRSQLGAEFDRVANALETRARQQDEPNQFATRAVIAILAEQRAQVMAHDRAGYFIHEWQDLDGRVRQMLAKDSRYQSIKAAIQANRRPVNSAQTTTQISTGGKSS